MDSWDFSDDSDIGNDTNSAEDFDISDFSDADDQISLFDDTDDFANDISSIDNSEEEFFAEEVDTPGDISDSAEFDEQLSVDEYLEIQEDIRYTPSEDSELGEWTGDRGNSIFVPYDNDLLNSLGLDGIPYCDGEPRFTDASAASIYISRDDMENMGDAQQKELFAQTLQLDLFEETDDDCEVVNWNIVEAVMGENIDEFYGAILSGQIPEGFVVHHGEIDDDGGCTLQLIPADIHKSCRHRGGRSHSHTSR